MKKISTKEYKELLIGILAYFNKLCRENNIKYSLIAGSLIGAVREGGIIPWDDDIDVILMPEEYKKLLAVIRKEKNTRYKALIPLETKDYFMPYIKIVDTHTYLIDDDTIQIKDNGIFIDVFKYGYVKKEKAKRLYKKTKIYRWLLAGVVDSKKKNNNFKNIMKNIRRLLFSKLFTYQRIIKKYDSLFQNKKAEYVIINFPPFGPPKDLQKTADTNEYIDYKFEGINAMIFKNYDNILNNTFGDYMTPPPKDKRISHHHITAYWK